MTIGTRVVHKRYPWLVGYVIGFGKGFGVKVNYGDAITLEDERDLRATPVQP